MSQFPWWTDISLAKIGYCHYFSKFHSSNRYWLVPLDMEPFACASGRNKFRFVLFGIDSTRCLHEANQEACGRPFKHPLLFWWCAHCPRNLGGAHTYTAVVPRACIRSQSNSAANKEPSWLSSVGKSGNYHHCPAPMECGWRTVPRAPWRLVDALA